MTARVMSVRIVNEFFGATPFRTDWKRLGRLAAAFSDAARGGRHSFPATFVQASCTVERNRRLAYLSESENAHNERSLGNSRRWRSIEL